MNDYQAAFERAAAAGPTTEAEGRLDADLVVWSGHPADLKSSVQAVYIDGKLGELAAHDRSVFAERTKIIARYFDGNGVADRWSHQLFLDRNLSAGDFRERHAQPFDS